MVRSLRSGRAGAFYSNIQVRGLRLEGSPSGDDADEVICLQASERASDCAPGHVVLVCKVGDGGEGLAGCPFAVADAAA